MIGARLEEQRGAPRAFASGLTQWLQGVDSAEAVAASRLIGEAVLRYIRSTEER